MIEGSNLEGYAGGMLTSTYQKTKRPNKVIRTTETLLALKEIVEATGASFAISRTEETHANIRISNKPYRVNLEDNLETIMGQIGIEIPELPEPAQADTEPPNEDPIAEIAETADKLHEVLSDPEQELESEEANTEE